MSQHKEASMCHTEAALGSANLLSANWRLSISELGCVSYHESKHQSTYESSSYVDSRK